MKVQREDVTCLQSQSYFVASLKSETKVSGYTTLVFCFPYVTLTSTWYEFYEKKSSISPGRKKLKSTSKAATNLG